MKPAPLAVLGTWHVQPLGSGLPMLSRDGPCTHSTGRYHHGFCLGCLLHKCMEWLLRQVLCPQKLLLDVSLVKHSLSVRKLQCVHLSVRLLGLVMEAVVSISHPWIRGRQGRGRDRTVPHNSFTPARRVQSKGYFCPCLLVHPVSLKKVIESPHQRRTGLQNMPLGKLIPLSFMMGAEF